jgi:hypothetical protein
MNELLKDRKLDGAAIAGSPRPELETLDGMDMHNSDHADGLGETYTGRNSGNETAYDRLDAEDSRPLQPNALFAADELHQFRSNWDQVQGSFVDEPRSAVQQADALVADVVNRITEQFASEREQLENRWARGEDANTEDLRQTFKRYRAFFDRLLSFKGDETSIAATPGIH